MSHRKIGICLYIIWFSMIAFIIYISSLNTVEGYFKDKRGYKYAVVFSELVSDKEKESFDKAVTYIDDSVIHSFLRHNGTIMVSDADKFVYCLQKDLDRGLPYKQNVSYDSIAGYFGTSTDVKLFKADPVFIVHLNSGYSEMSLAHELGHYIDYITGSTDYFFFTESGAISNTSEFQTIYEEEWRNSGLATYFTNNSEEFFAESYNQMKKNPEEYYERCPQTCAYIENIVENIK